MRRTCFLLLLIALALLRGGASAQTVYSVNIVGFKSLPATPLGQATLSVISNGLRVANIGPSGQDGVSFDLQELSRTATLSFGQAGFTLPGLGKLSFSAHGMVNDVPERFLGTVVLQRQSNLVAEVSHTGPGTVDSTLRVEVYDGAVLAGTVVRPANSLIGSLSGDVRLRSIKAGEAEPSGSDFALFELEFSASVAFEPVMSGSLHGNRIRLVALNPPGLLQNLARLDATGSRLDSVLIEDADAPQFQPLLRLERTDQGLTLKWDTQAGVLQGATAVHGPWTDVTHGTNSARREIREGSEFYRLEVPERTGDLANDVEVPPLPAVEQAVNAFKVMDPDASFNYFNGHVNSFATTPKLTVPDYALPVLQSLGLPTAAQIPRKLPAMVPGPRVNVPDDGDLNVQSAIPAETETGSQSITPGPSDNVSDVPLEQPLVAIRTLPSPNPMKLLEWDRPSDEELAVQRQAVVPIVKNFLALHQDVFEVTSDEFDTAMRLVKYQSGAYFRRAQFEASYSPEEKVLYGKALVHFDVNWNVVSISRMIVTPAKVPVATVSNPVSRAQAIAAASVPPDCAGCGVGGHQPELVRADYSVDLIRRLRVWNVEMRTPDGMHWRTIVDAATGWVLNVSDLTGHYNDAKLNRWGFPGGDLYNPRVVEESGIHTRDDRRLEHPFFYVMNDYRCEGNPPTACTALGFACQWCQEAYGTTTGGSYIRATRRTDRDWTDCHPANTSGTGAFGETQTYFWAARFCQWLKPTLDVYGVLPNSVDDYTRVLIVNDACYGPTSKYNSPGNYLVTTENNKGEGCGVIRMGRADPTGADNFRVTCQGGSCYPNPSELHHELTHFFLREYFDVGFDLDCAGSVQLLYTHEGILGSVVPHARWNFSYAVGYNPGGEQYLYLSDNNDDYKVHHSNPTRMHLSNYNCGGGTSDPHRWGRVVGQPLWEFYHGIRIKNGNQTESIMCLAPDDIFNLVVFWAADLQSGSTRQDRKEFANRFMQIIDKFSGASSNEKGEYCEVFRHHGLTRIDSDYCN